MKLTIDKRELELLIEKKKDYIGSSRNWLGALEAFLLLISAYTASYPALIIPSIVIKFVFSLIAALQLIMLIHEYYKKPKYTKDDLIKDIERLNMTERKSSIIAIQNTEHPTKYLLYSDLGWGLKLFPNFATVSDDTDNIKRKLSEELEINAGCIHVEHKTTAHEIKYSTEHDEERSYNYTLYKARIDGFEHDEEDSFSIAGKNYVWMSIPEMLEDKTLKKHNEFVIALVRDNT